jgi:hypothetical protein
MPDLFGRDVRLYARDHLGSIRTLDTERIMVTGPERDPIFTPHGEMGLGMRLDPGQTVFQFASHGADPSLLGHEVFAVPSTVVGLADGAEGIPLGQIQGMTPRDTNGVGWITVRSNSLTIGPDTIVPASWGPAPFTAREIDRALALRDEARRRVPLVPSPPSWQEIVQQNGIDLHLNDDIDRGTGFLREAWGPIQRQVLPLQDAEPLSAARMMAVIQEEIRVGFARAIRSLGPESIAVQTTSDEPSFDYRPFLYGQTGRNAVGHVNPFRVSYENEEQEAFGRQVAGLSAKKVIAASQDAPSGPSVWERLRHPNPYSEKP